MTDDNTIDITNRLPPIEVRKPWRQRLPSYYAEKIDTLKDSCESLRRLITEVKSTRRNFPDRLSGSLDVYEAEGAAKNVSDALVLLKCAQEKLDLTVPMEEWMSPNELKEYGRG